MIAIVDYSAGNLFSVKNALDFLEINYVVTSDPEELEKSDGIILPGVGAFPDAMRMLKQYGLVDVLKEQAQKKPFLGICLGMQVLFEKGYEFEETEGLGLIPGSVRRIQAPGLKIPHMGWNSLRIHAPCALLKGIPADSYVYFVHSYCAETPEQYLAASCEYGEQVTALVQRGQIFGAQFHPEKSGELGLQILRNFYQLTQNK